MDKNKYDSSNIRVLQGLEAVRKRPAMYIGGTDREGLHHLFTELLDNAVDEAIAGFCDHINVILHKDGSLEVRDNGRGIPVDIHPQTKVSTLETVMTNLHAGGKFDKGAYKVSGGLHGVGMKCTNALSEWMETTVYKDGKEYKQRYERGIPVTKVEEIGKTTERGTRHIFLPDVEIFKEHTKFSFKRVLEKCRQHAYLTAGLKFTIIDERVEKGEEKIVYQLYFEDGIKSYVKFMNLGEKALSDIFYIKAEEESVIVETALQYGDSLEEDVVCYTNNIINPEGGTHLAGFRTAITSAINSYATSNDLLKGVKETALGGDDVREGLTAVVSVKVPDPQFEGQTKIKLNNPEVKSIVQKVVRDGLVTYFNENPNEAKAIIGKAVLAFKARAAAKAARDAVIRKGVLEGTALPGKLADCQSKDPNECELYIVEGDSAGGCFEGHTKVSLTDGRNISFVDLLSEQAKGIQNYCYTINKQGEIQIAPILNVRKTNENVEVIKVVLDTLEEIICTPNHLFMLRNGKYKKAKDLTKADSIMPLKKKLSTYTERITIENYEMVLNPRTHKWVFTHVLADKYNLERNKYATESGTYRHHIDFNKANNNPDNIVRLTKDEHLRVHQECCQKNLHTPEVLRKLKEMRRTPEFRAMMSAAMNKPEVREAAQERARIQWTNEEYKEYMKDKFQAYYVTHPVYQVANAKLLNDNQRKYWASEQNRGIQSERTRTFFAQNPDAKQALSSIAKRQWQNSTLLQWRSQMTKQQWTPEFRQTRKESYNRTYLNKALSLMKSLIEKNGSVNQKTYEARRKDIGDRSLLRIDTICTRFFNGDSNLMFEAAQNYNHKITRIERLNERVDVYDFEVPETHNFALASGVFVHNSAKQGRDRRTQAVLPLRGKIINSHKYRVDRVLANNEFKDIVTALGVGIGETLNVDNLRYGKIIIMSDADVDGSHITTLVLTLLYRFFRPLIEKGHVYIAQPPLFKVEVGKERFYLLNDKEKNAFVEEIKAKGKNPVVSRFKGLGEMNPEQLRETAMEVTNRVLKRVNINDAQEAEKVFETLMGIEVAPRRRFIQKFAKLATLDV